MVLRHQTAPEARAPLAAAALLLALGAGACGGGGADPAVSTEPPESADRELDVHFADLAVPVGLTHVSVSGNATKSHLLESTGSGVAVADYDGDGDEDLYFATAQTSDDWLAGRRPAANALYRNNGDGTFTDVAAEAGVALRAWSAGTYFADYDNDGDRDLFVTTWGPNVLYRNNGDGTFSDVTARAGVAGRPDGWSAGAAFGDLDSDGDLDLFVTNYCDYDLADPPYGGTKTTWKGLRVYRGPGGFTGQLDELYRNNGDGTFSDVSRASGIAGEFRPLYGLGVVMSDLDDDGDLDIYVANDSCPNQLWRNDGELRFVDVAPECGVATNEDAKEQAGMGTDAADYDGDGLIDLFVTNFSHDWNTLYRNTGGLSFIDATFQAGLKDAYLPLAWGTKLFDFDNDGVLDLFVANGHIYPEVDEHPHLNTSYAAPNLLYRGRGDGTFDNVTERAGPGLAVRESTRGAALLDLEGDGDQDLVLTNLDAVPSLLVNEGDHDRSWCALILSGTRSNRDAIGARVELEAGGKRQLRELNPFGSYQSQSSYRMHFGLGTAEVVDLLRIHWPSGHVDVFKQLPVRRVFRIAEGQPLPEEPR